MAKKFLSPLNLLNLTSDPGTAAEGDFYWNSSTNRLRIYFDGAWADVSSNTVFTNQANTFTVSPQQITIDNAANKGFIVKAASSQSANLQEWQDSSGTVLSNINNVGAANFVRVGIGGATPSTVPLFVTSPNSTYIAAIVRGAPSQTANLTEWQDTSGAIRTSVSAFGVISHGNPAQIFQNSGGTDSRVSISTVIATATGIIIRGVASQTANLQEWQDSAGTVLASISPTGGFTIPSLTVSGDFTVNGTTTNINTTNLVVEDKNIILGDVTTPSNTTADGGGITLKGATDKTFNWVNSTGYWTSNVGFEASSIIKTGGTSSQFLKADGSVDSSTYLTTGTASSTYAPLASPSLTGIPLSTTAASSVSSTQIATTAYVKSLFGADSTSGTLDWNDVSNTRPGGGPTLLLGTATNGPGDGNYYHPFNFEYAGDSGVGNVTQIAVGYGTPGNLLKMRGRYSGTWSSWVTFATLSGGIYTGQIQSTLANSTSDGGGQIYLNGATGNRIDFNSNGVAAPSFTTRSLGTKIVLYPSLSVSAVDYALGIENNNLWFSVPDSSRGFKWYSGTTQVASLNGSGLFTAVSKSFDIEHPTKPDMRLRYGSLEGPENGVYVRGNTKENIIELPEYWTGLVDESTITVSLTSVGKFQKVYLEKIEGNKVYIGGRVKEISYVVFGERKDIDKITVEY